MRKGNAKIGIVVGIVAFYSEVQPVDSVSTVNLEALPVLSSNRTNLSSVVIDERGGSETSEGCSAVELYLEHQKNIVNASGCLQVTVPVQLKATGERNFYIFKVWCEEV